MWLDQMGYNSVALLGASISATQVQLLQDLPIGEIVLCLDSDEAGRIGTDRCLTKLSSTCRISYIELPEGNKDIQEISDKALIDQIISNRNYW
jgi:DNA primase